MRIIAALSLLLPTLLFAADATKPHDHRGLIRPNLGPDGAPPEVPLKLIEQNKINAGEVIYKQTSEGSGGHAVAVFKVNASPHYVWKVISDFDKYPQWISNLKESKVYKREGDKIFVEFTIKVWPTTTTYFIEHNYPMEKKGWGTWRLDYSRLSDLDESIGFWRVKPVEGNPNESIVFYSVDVRIKGFLNVIKGFIEKKGLKEATQWVKVAAEELSKSESAPTKEVAKVDEKKIPEAVQKVPTTISNTESATNPKSK